jgi:hypothetical protein
MYGYFCRSDDLAISVIYSRIMQTFSVILYNNTSGVGECITILIPALSMWTLFFETDNDLWPPSIRPFPGSKNRVRVYIRGRPTGALGHNSIERNCDCDSLIGKMPKVLKATPQP